MRTHEAPEPHVWRWCLLETSSRQLASQAHSPGLVLRRRALVEFAHWVAAECLEAPRRGTSRGRVAGACHGPCSHMRQLLSACQMLANAKTG